MTKNIENVKCNDSQAKELLSHFHKEGRLAHSLVQSSLFVSSGVHHDLR